MGTNDESLVGRTVYYRPFVPFTAETEPPVPVEVVAECKYHWCVRLPDGSLELVYRGLRDRRLFTEPPARAAEPAAG